VVEVLVVQVLVVQANLVEEVPAVLLYRHFGFLALIHFLL
jgi:hypothetical protein